MPKWHIAAAAAALIFLTAPLCGAQEAAPVTNGFVNFSFDQVDVRSFVKLVGETTGRRIVVDQNVDGKITVVFPRIPVADVLRVFISILESAGCSVVEEQGGMLRVVAMSTRPTIVAPVIGPNEKIPPQGFFTKIFAVQFVDAGDLRKLLETKVRGGKEGAIASIGDNYLVVTDTADSLMRISQIVIEVDKPGLSRTTEVVALKYASAEELAAQLSRAMAGGTEDRWRAARMMSMNMAGSGGTGAAQDNSQKPVVIVASPHSNSLILVGDLAQVMELKRIVSLMDVDSPSGRGRLSAIFLKYASAEDAAKNLNALLAKRTALQPGRTDFSQQSQSTATGIFIEPNMANNALIVDAMPRDFELVSALVKELDKMPEQVLIEVLIAEVSLRDDSNIGVDIVALNMPSEVGATTIQGGSTARETANTVMNAVQTGIFPKGITVGLARGVSKKSDGTIQTAFPAMINIDAIRQNRKFNILSRIPLLAQNNRDASVSIVNNIPMLKSTIQGAGANLQVIQNIDRVDVGIKLKLTPHINPDGEVMMTLNPIIEAIIDPGSIADNLAPTIAHREVTTTVTVPSGRTLVLSGLMRDDQTQTDRRVPILGSIPLLGWLFRQKADGREKTNLLIFVTPHVVKDDETAQKLTESWKDTTSLLKTNTPVSVRTEK